MGIGPLLQFPYPQRAGPVLLTLLFFPLVPLSYRVLRGSVYSFPLVRYSCLLSAGVLHALLSEGVFLMYPQREMYFIHLFLRHLVLPFLPFLMPLSVNFCVPYSSILVTPWPCFSFSQTLYFSRCTGPAPSAFPGTSLGNLMVRSHLRLKGIKSWGEVR